jgi:hypothetical protein
VFSIKTRNLSRNPFAVVERPPLFSCRLNGRATVVLEIARKGDDTFVVKGGGGPKDTAVLELVIDGYSAPITAGNFADLVSTGKCCLLHATPVSINCI